MNEMRISDWQLGMMLNEMSEAPLHTFLKWKKEAYDEQAIVRELGDYKIMISYDYMLEEFQYFAKLKS